MGRNDGYNHHHYKQAYSRGSSKNQQHRPHQYSAPSSHQSVRNDSFPDSRRPPPQIPPFIPIQPPPPANLLHQVPPTIFSQQVLQQNPQQMYFNLQNQQQYLAQPPPLRPYDSLNHCNSQCNPNLAVDPTNWPNLVMHNNRITPPSTTQTYESTNPALSQLQLPSNQITETGIIPTAPYYELPAGLMAPLIGPSQKTYKPLNPADLRLPLPKFPDENFLRSIDSYYGSDGKVRDNDGWDRQFIETFMGQKAALNDT